MTRRTLKPGWRRVKFGDVVRQVKDRVDPQRSGLTRYVAGEHMDTDDLRLRRWGEIGNVYLGPAFHMRFRPGQVLYGSRRTYLRKVAVADFEGICANTTYVLESKDPSVLLPELLPFIMQTESFHEHSITQSKGSVNPYINFSDLEWYEFALPPLEEQERIAAVLSAMDELIMTYEGHSSALDHLASSLVDSVCNETDANNIVCAVNDLLQEGPRNGYSPPSNLSGRGHKTISISAVSLGRLIVERNLKSAEVNADRIQPFLIREGDAFVIRGNGNRDLAGKCGLAHQSYPDVFYPDLLIRLRFDESKILRGFAVLQWNLPRIHRRLIARAKSTNGIWKVNGTDLREHRLIVPPLPIQTQLMSNLNRLEHTGKELAKRMISARDLRRQVLATSLSGRV